MTTLELGNANAGYFDAKSGQMVSHELGAPTVTTVSIGHHLAESFDYGLDVEAYKRHLYDAVITNKGVTNHVAANVTSVKRKLYRADDVSEDTVEGDDYSGAAALEVVVHPDGTWGKHSLDAKPTWVWSDDEAFGRIVAGFYNVPYGKPAEVELTHYTNNGPPGTEGPLTPHVVDVVKDIKALLVNTGRDMWAQGQARSQVVLNQQTATAAGTTSITGTGTPFTASAYIGMIVVDNTTGVWGNIQSNTTSVLTVDRWYNPATPNGTAGSTPGSTDKFTIVQAVSPAQWMGITANATAAGATDTQLPSEIVTAGGGLIRAITTYAHSAGTNTYTSANTFTANGTDTLPVTIAKMGLFNSIVVASTINMWFETLLNATATLTTSGDAVTITDTVTGS